MAKDKRKEVSIIPVNNRITIQLLIQHMNEHHYGVLLKHGKVREFIREANSHLDSEVWRWDAYKEHIKQVLILNKDAKYGIKSFFELFTHPNKNWLELHKEAKLLEYKAKYGKERN